MVPSRPGTANIIDHDDLSHPDRVKMTLMRKVAQLTKVLVHLTARNEEGEARYEKLKLGFEEKIRTLTRDACGQVVAHREQLKQNSDPKCLGHKVRQSMERWKCEEEGVRAECSVLRKEIAASQKQLLFSGGESRLSAATAEVCTLTCELSTCLEAFKETAGQKRAEFERRSAALRKQGSQQLQELEAEQRRRLQDLRTAHEREVEHLHGVRGQTLSHLRKLHESELSTLKMKSLQNRREKVHRLEQDFNDERAILEHLTSAMVRDIEQLNRETADLKDSGPGIKIQIDNMRAVLAEIANNVGAVEVDKMRAEQDLEARELELIVVRKEVSKLQEMQSREKNVKEIVHSMRSVCDSRADLSGKLRSTVAGIDRMEMEIELLAGELAELEDDLEVKEKEVSLLEVELEEELLRVHQIRNRVEANQKR